MGMASKPEFKKKEVVKQTRKPEDMDFEKYIGE